MHEQTGKPYYECVALKIGEHPQAILAYELNGEPLPLQHGAPLWTRFETKLGFKMVKFLRAIEVVDDYRTVGDGVGGVREDEQQFDMGAEI
jgi:DMSO/TMAO reductase YedYZ molybdopterin-dependent catalytic subunit